MCTLISVNICDLFYNKWQRQSNCGRSGKLHLIEQNERKALKMVTMFQKT